jgi:5-methylcytosine-specific restriction endonuclease McrA
MTLSRKKNRPWRKWKREQYKNCHVLPCTYCGARLLKLEATVDHIIPRSKGGEDDPVNYALACKPCNNQKDDALELFFK